MLVLVQVVDDAASLVAPADADVAVANTSRSLSPTRSTIALEVELAGDPLLDAVDDRELGVALLGFLEQALRLVEQARVLERDAHARGHGLQQAHFASPKACSRS